MDAQIASALEAFMGIGGDDECIQSELKEAEQNRTAELVVYDPDIVRIDKMLIVK